MCLNREKAKWKCGKRKTLCKPAGKPQEKPTRPTPCFGLLVSRTMREQISVVEAPNLVFCYGGPSRLVVVQSPSRVQLFATHGLQHTRPPCPSPSPGVCPSSCSLHRWRNEPAISSSDALFSFCPQSSSASGTFPMSHLFTSDDQNTGASASASVLPVNIRDWSPLRLTSTNRLVQGVPSTSCFS